MRLPAVAQDQQTWCPILATVCVVPPEGFESSHPAPLAVRDEGQGPRKVIIGDCGKPDPFGLNFLCLGSGIDTRYRKLSSLLTPLTSHYSSAYLSLNPTFASKVSH